MKSDSVFDGIRSKIVIATVFLLPLTFLPFTQEYFTMNKFVLLFAAALLLILNDVAQLAITRRPVSPWRNFYWPFVAFLLATLMPVVFALPNSLDTLFNVNSGTVLIASILIVIFNILRTESYHTAILPVCLSSSLVALWSIANILLQPFAQMPLPQTWAILKLPTFTPIGNALDTAVCFGFAFILLLNLLYQSRRQEKRELYWWIAGMAVVNALALALMTAKVGTAGILNNLPGYHFSWLATLETLKNPLTAVFGTGQDGFSVLFTRVKDIAYNQSNHWQVESYDTASSGMMQIGVMFGLAGIASLFWTFLSSAKHGHRAGVYLMTLVLIFLPVSLMVLFLFFLSFVLVLPPAVPASKTQAAPPASGNGFWTNALVLSVLSILGIAAAFNIGRFYLADHYMLLSKIGLSKNNLREFYENQARAVNLNPKNESYRVIFSQTNAMLAMNLASKKNPETDRTAYTQDEQTLIAKTIQVAIEQAKIAVSLNSQKAQLWINLATIYRSIMGSIEGADAWTISSYQRAILLDQYNPLYRFDLGSTYYALGYYGSAAALFQQATTLKADWPNAYYNLAWSYYRNENYAGAVQEMEQTIKLMSGKKNDPGFQKARKDLELFKNRIKTDNDGNTVATGESSLKLAAPLASPGAKLRLPSGSSPANLP